MSVLLFVIFFHKLLNIYKLVEVFKAGAFHVSGAWSATLV